MYNFENKGVYLWKQYSLHVQTGVLLSLAVVLMALQINWSTTPGFDTTIQPPEVIKAKDIEPTKHQESPPPPKPLSPVEVPDNKTIAGDSPDYDISVTPNKETVSDVPPPPTEKPSREETLFQRVEEQPTLIGGMEALYESVEYPAFAKQAGIQGRVIVQFIVDENGKVQTPTVVRGVHKLLNKEAIRAIKEQKFEPGKQRGTPVRVQMTIPITFRLQ